MDTRGVARVHPTCRAGEAHSDREYQALPVGHAPFPAPSLSDKTDTMGKPDTGDTLYFFASEQHLIFAPGQHLVMPRGMKMTQVTYFFGGAAILSGYVR